VYTGAACIVTNGLAAGSTFNCSSAVNIPANLTPGTWYLFAIADDQSQVDESDEGNNLRASDSGLISLSSPSGGGPQCGIERWSVKTGTDTDANLVNLNSITSTTIAALSALPAPANKPENNRVAPTETTVFVLNATLTDYVLEDDSDYHLVLKDTSGKTMIVEVPSPTCVGPGSPFLPGITNARSEFNARFTTTTSFKTANVPVQVKGVGFFDFIHGQTGVADNGIELHPVLDISFSQTPVITSVNTAGGFQGITQNDWIEIKGTNLAPATVGSSGMTWSDAPEFDRGAMPTQLKGVSVKVNGKAAYVYYISPTQINVLTPLDGTQGQISIIATVGSESSVAFNASALTVAPSFLRFGSGNYVVATHANGTLIGPTSASVPGYSFTPAQPGETVLLYGVGFGLPLTPLAEGSATQSGILPTLPVVQIGGFMGTVQFGGLISPGLYQFNVVVPAVGSVGDNEVIATYSGTSTPAGALLTIQPR